MKKLGDMKLYSMDEVLDEAIGTVGTAERTEFDRSVDEAVHAYQVGEAIRRARLQQNMTQEELGRLVGVKKSQISKIERGANMTLRSYSRIFKALGITTAMLDLGSIGKVALW